MTAKLWLQCADIAFVLFSAVTLLVMWRRGVVRTFFALALFLAVNALDMLVSIGILFHRKALGLGIDAAYNMLFVSHWVSYVAETVLLVAVIFSVFNSAIAPLEGLHKIGKIVFKWVASVSAVLALVIALGPHLFSSGTPNTVALTSVLQRFQDGVGVLTLCLLLFVCFAIKPLGLTYRSHIFGVSLGLGIFSTVQLVEAAWFSTTQAHSVYSPIYLVIALGYCVALGVWSGYFAMPEPARSLITLPTTSPFHLWNRLCEAMGDQPGQVAIAGFPREMMAPGELKVLTEMSRRREAAEAEAEADSAELDLAALNLAALEASAGKVTMLKPMYQPIALRR